MEVILIKLSQFTGAQVIPKHLESAFIFMNDIARRLNLKIHFIECDFSLRLIDSSGIKYSAEEMISLENSPEKYHPVKMFLKIWKLSGHYKNFTDHLNKSKK